MDMDVWYFLTFKCNIGNMTTIVQILISKLELQNSIKNIAGSKYSTCITNSLGWIKTYEDCFSLLRQSIDRKRRFTNWRTLSPEDKLADWDKETI